MTESTANAFIAAFAALLVAFLTQFVAEAYRRFRDGSALAAGILGELASHEKAAAGLQTALKSWADSTDADAGARPVLRPITGQSDLVYERAAEKLGLLGVELAEDVVFVYSNIRAFRAGYDLLARHHGEMAPVEFKIRCGQCWMLIEQATCKSDELFAKLRARARRNFISVRIWR
jgi:hypothetical protein